MGECGRQKVCHGCKEAVDVEVIFCPYCGSDVLADMVVDSGDDDSVILEKTNASLYPSQKSCGKSACDEKGNHKNDLILQLSAIVFLTLAVWAITMAIVCLWSGGIIFSFVPAHWLYYLFGALPLTFIGVKLLYKLK